MNIKSLRILGFKSFGQETEISFHRGLNAIVGPNGCGKSNISDALKWIMGEQNVRQLRGERLEDIIFSGGGESKPLGMAEVSMVVEQNGGGFPPEYEAFSELEITRRVFRSGESAYFINRKPCLLRNIREIFMDTGLNPRAYSIIEQGSIMEVVNSSPQDLRKLLEEAAGITKYRERKAATLRKIDSTRDNLDRVNDITLEVQRQVRSARRQAGEAKRYMVYRERLTAMEACLFRHLHDDLRRRWETAAGRHAELSVRAEGERGAVAVAEARIEEARVRLLGLEKDLAEAQENYYRTAGRLEVSESRIQHLGEKIEELRATREKTLEELSLLVSRRETLQDGLASAESALSRTRAALAQMEPSLEELRERERLHRDAAESRRMALGKSRGELEAVLARKRSHLEEEATVEARLGGDARFLEDYGLETRRLGALEESLALDRDKASEASAVAAGDLERLDGELAAVRQEMLAGEESLREVASSAAEGLRTLTALQGRLGYLEKVQKEGENLREGARRLLHLASAGEESGARLVGVLGHLVQVEDTYRTAVEALLAERLEAVLVEGEEQALGLAARLKDESVSGATVVPYGTWGDRNGSKPPPEGTLGQAANFVSTSNGVEGLVRHLLRDVYLVSTLDEAMELRRRGHHALTFCTLEGDVVHPWGGFSVGGGRASGGVLAVAEELKRLRRETPALRKRQEKIEGREAALREQITGLRSRLEDLHAARLEAERLAAALAAETIRLERELAETSRRRQSASEELTRRREQREKDLAALAELKERLGGLAVEEKRLSLSLQQQQGGVDGPNGEHEDLARRISELEVSRATAQEKRQAQEETLERLRGELTGEKRRHEELEAALGELDERKREAESAMARSIEEREELSREGTGSAATVEGLQKEHRELSEQLEQKNGEWKSLRESAEATGGELSQASVEMAELKARMEETVDRARAETGQELVGEPPAELQDYLGEDPALLRERAHRLKERLASSGPVNMAAVDEVKDLQERLDFLTSQKQDLDEALAALHEAIRKINRTSREKFTETFAKVKEKFAESFQLLFNGGEAVLSLEEGIDVLEAGAHIWARPPGKKMTKLNLLSGGEKALTAIALLFALLAVRPAPFCLLDEVDAPLDEANIDRFLRLLLATMQGSQVVLITHNKQTMEHADNLVGVTMETPGISKLVSVSLDGRRN